MGYEFSIYPGRCREQIESLKGIASGLKNDVSRLEKIKSELSGSSGIRQVVAPLVGVIAEIQDEKKAADALKQVLEQCVGLYEQTEQKLTGQETEVEKPVDKPESGKEPVLGNIMEGISTFHVGDLLTIVNELLLEDGLKNSVWKDLNKILKGTYIRSKRENGIVRLYLHQNNMQNAEIRQWLTENLDGTWDDYRARNMRRAGLDIYNYHDNHYTRKARYFKNTSDIGLNEWVNNLDDNFAGKAFKNSFKDGINVLDDFNYKDFGRLSGFGKAGKIAGTAGTVLTVGGDVVDNFYDSNTGEWSFSGNQVADCVCDIAIDVGTGAGAMAAGAAAGSFFAPPVGTVVGAAAGLAVNAAVNIGVADVDGDGKKDSVVDMVKIGVHSAVDWTEKTIGGMWSGLQKAFSF